MQQKKYHIKEIKQKMNLNGKKVKTSALSHQTLQLVKDVPEVHLSLLIIILKQNFNLSSWYKKDTRKEH